MNEPMGAPMGEAEPKKSKTWLVVLIVVLVVCCVCVVAAAGGYWLWNNGDRLLESFGALMTV